MKTIKVLSKNMFDKFCLLNGINDSSVNESFTDYAFISIHNTKDDYVYTFKQDHENVINLTFDDVEEDIIKKSAFAMTENQAKILYEFMIKHSDKNTFLIHCTAGISRSGAVGTFIANYFNVDMNTFKLDNPYILPNSHVSKLLNRFLWEQHFNNI